MHFFIKIVLEDVLYASNIGDYSKTGDTFLNIVEIVVVKNLGLWCIQLPQKRSFARSGNLI